jgi:hypothetical protein
MLQKRFGFSILLKNKSTMKQTAFTFLAAALLLACNDRDASTSPAGNTDSGKTASADQTAVKKEAAPAAMPDSATMAKNWGEYATPSEIHKMMASWDGNWDGEVKMWMVPDAPPETSQLKTVNKMIYNGMYHQSTHTGTVNGMPFNGTGTMAYDNHRKVIINTWIDNMGSGVLYTEGGWDAATKTVESKGKFVDPGTKEILALREVMKVLDDNTQVLTHYHTREGGQEAKVMEITFKRKK